MKVTTYIEQEKVQLSLFTDTNMSRNIANMTDKIELIIEDRRESKRFQTTYSDLLKIMESADEKLSQSTKPEQE